MSIDREKLTSLKESFWKEPINEAARVAFENDKVTIHGPMVSQEEIDAFLKGKMRSAIVTREGDGFSMFNSYYLGSGENFYVVIPKQGDDIWMVQVTSQALGSIQTWWDKSDHTLKPEQASQIMVALEIPTGDTNESVIK